MELAEKLKAQAEANERSLHATIVLALKRYAQEGDLFAEVVDDQGLRSPEAIAAAKEAWDSPALMEQFDEPVRTMSTHVISGQLPSTRTERYPPDEPKKPFKCPVCTRTYARQIRCACSNRMTIPV